MLDKTHRDILLMYEQKGLVPRVVSQERHMDDYGKEKRVVLLGSISSMGAKRFDRIIPERPVSRTTLWRWNKEDEETVSN